MAISIDNLTDAQCEMLDIMWAFETSDEYLSWFENLDDEDQREAAVLQTLVILESMEEMMNNYEDAKRVLQKFRL